MWAFGSLRDVGGTVLFSADDGVNGLELWATDGKTTTSLVQNIAEGAGWSSPRSFTPVGPLVFFTADDHVSGTELWAMWSSAAHQEMDLPGTTADRTSRDDASPGRRPRTDEFRAFVPIFEDDPRDLLADAGDAR